MEGEASLAGRGRVPRRHRTDWKGSFRATGCDGGGGFGQGARLAWLPRGGHRIDRRADGVMHAYELAAEELRPNKGQWAAYEARGNAVILAGPGSGKTKVLTIKMARLLAEDVRAPRGVACVTYSNECARELQRRLTKLGVTLSAAVFVGTLHGFCLRH